MRAANLFQQYFEGAPKRAWGLISFYRKSINPPYREKDLLTIFLSLIIFLTIPLTTISIYQRHIFRASAASPEEIKVRIAGEVDNELISIPNWGSDSFGKFLWGLAGCETGYGQDPSAYDSYGDYFGLYQYTTTTWNGVWVAMGEPAPNIFDDFSQIRATAYVIRTGYGDTDRDGTSIDNQWSGCTDGGGREWTQFVGGWPTCENKCSL